MFDFLVKNASLPDGREGIDIACKNGLITNVEKNISAEAKETIDANGWLLAPPFIDPHFHMDATLSLGTPRLNKSDLWERVVDKVHKCVCKHKWFSWST